MPGKFFQIDDGPLVASVVCSKTIPILFHSTISTMFMDQERPTITLGKRSMLVSKLRTINFCIGTIGHQRARIGSGMFCAKCNYNSLQGNQCHYQRMPPLECTYKSARSYRGCLYCYSYSIISYDLISITNERHRF